MNASAIAEASTLLTRAVRDAVLALLAMVGAVACACWVDPAPGTVVLGAVLALSLHRSPALAGRRGWLEALATLPVVSLACMGVGHLLHAWPWLGALVFVAAVSSSSWVRRFGPRAQRLGRLVMLPFVTLLIVPPMPRDTWPLPPAFALLAPLLIALAALASVLLVRGLARLAGWAAAAPGDGAPAPAPSPGTLRPSAPTRLTLQMAVSLASAFAVGFLLFPDHWRWLVLTALLVNVASIGQFDVVRRGLLRVLGAAGGTVLAMGVAGHAGGDGALVGVLAMGCVFAGLVLRVFGYGWWVLCVTLALALLQTLEPAAEPLLLWRRLLEIVIGAAIAIAASSFVFPIPSADILRRRIAGALAAMSEALDPATAERRPQAIVGTMALVRQMLPVFRAQGIAHRLARRRDPPPHATWIAALLACEAPVLALVESGQAPGAVRKAIGTARKAMREPGEIGPALAALAAALARLAPGGGQGDAEPGPG